MYRKSFTIDMQREDNGQQFTTSVFAEDLAQAKVLAVIYFRESKVLIVWEPTEISESTLLSQIPHRTF